MSYNWDQSCKVYIGNLGNNGSLYEIKSIFAKYGKLRNAWIARNPPGFAFIEFEDSRDAKDAVRVLDGTRICGVHVRVEMSNNRSSRNGRNSRDYDYRGGRGHNNNPIQYYDRIISQSTRSHSRSRSCSRSCSRSRSRSPRSRSHSPRKGTSSS